MANKVKNGYECGYCHKLFTDPIECDVHKDSHNLIYVALSKEDLNRLVNFIYNKDEAILSNNIVERLQSYLRGSFSMELWDKNITTKRELK